MSVGLSLLVLAVGLAVLIASADALVASAVSLARRAGVSEFAVGVTVVAFGTSAPELFASAGAVLQGQPDLAVGNVVGSNIANVLLILGVGGVLAPIHMSRRVRLVEVPLMALVTLGAWLLMLDGRLGRFEGSVLLLGLAGYVYAVVRSGAVRPEDAGDASGSPLWRDAALLIAGIAGLGLGARALVIGAVALAQRAGVPEGIIGATVVAFGTSLPELAATVRAAMSKKSDIAVGNIIGSNVFNLLCVLGACAAIRPLSVPDAMGIHLLVMGLATGFLVLYALWTGVIGRWWGLVFVAGYLSYVGYLVAATVTGGV